MWINKLHPRHSTSPAHVVWQSYISIFKLATNSEWTSAHSRRGISSCRGCGIFRPLTFVDPGHVFISINTATFTCRTDAPLVDLWMKSYDTPPAKMRPIVSRQHICHAPRWSTAPPMGGRRMVSVLHNLAAALHVWAGRRTVWESGAERQTEAEENRWNIGFSALQTFN